MSGICQHMVNWLNTSLYIKSCHVKWMQIVIDILFHSISYDTVFSNPTLSFLQSFGLHLGPLLCCCWAPLVSVVLWPGRFTKDLGNSFVISNMSFLHPFGLHVGLHVGLPPGLPKWLTDIQQTNRLMQGVTNTYIMYTYTYTICSFRMKSTYTWMVKFITSIHKQYTKNTMTPRIRGTKPSHYQNVWPNCNFAGFNTNVCRFPTFEHHLSAWNHQFESPWFSAPNFQGKVGTSGKRLQSYWQLIYQTEGWWFSSSQAVKRWAEGINPSISPYNYWP